MFKIILKLNEFRDKHKKALMIVDLALSVAFIILVLDFGLRSKELVNAAKSDEDLRNFFFYGFLLYPCISFIFHLLSLFVDLIFEFIPSKKKNNRISSEKSD